MWEIQANSLKKYVNLQLDITINEFPSKRLNIEMPKNDLMVHEVIWCTDQQEAFATIKENFGQQVYENLKSAMTYDAILGQTSAMGH